jgi:putative DNA primase/helicase
VADTLRYLMRLVSTYPRGDAAVVTSSWISWHEEAVAVHGRARVLIATRPTNKTVMGLVHVTLLLTGDEDLAQHQQLAAAFALKRWTAATPCTNHDYLTHKGVHSHGAKIEGQNLLIPMRDTAGKLHSLQTIAPDGTKMFMPGGRVKGCYFSIGKPRGALIISEGLATGASIHECTGHAVAVAFNAGNLASVALALRTKYPTLKIIIAADNDDQTPGNPGMTKAKTAADAVGGVLAVPVFKEKSA